MCHRAYDAPGLASSNDVQYAPESVPIEKTDIRSKPAFGGILACAYAWRYQNSATIGFKNSVQEFGRGCHDTAKRQEGSSHRAWFKIPHLCNMRRLGGMAKAYPDSETTKTRYAVRKRTGVFRTRHAAKDRGGG
jgi:hypothetical protein